MLGITRRIAGSYGQVRPEMAEGCPEKIDLEFFRYVWTFRRQQRPKLLDYFRGLRADQSLVLQAPGISARDIGRRFFIRSVSFHAHHHVSEYS